MANKTYLRKLAKEIMDGTTEYTRRVNSWVIAYDLGLVDIYSIDNDLPEDKYNEVMEWIKKEFASL